MKNPRIDGSFFHWTRLDHLVRVDGPAHLPAAQVAGPWAAPFGQARSTCAATIGQAFSVAARRLKGLRVFAAAASAADSGTPPGARRVIRAPVQTYAPDGNWQAAGLRRRKPGRSQRPSGHGRPMGRPFRLSRRDTIRAKSRPAAARRYIDRRLCRYGHAPGIILIRILLLLMGRPSI